MHLRLQLLLMLLIESRRSWGNFPRVYVFTRIRSGRLPHFVWMDGRIDFFSVHYMIGLIVLGLLSFWLNAEIECSLIVWSGKESRRIRLITLTLVYEDLLAWTNHICLPMVIIDKLGRVPTKLGLASITRVFCDHFENGVHILELLRKHLSLASDALIVHLIFDQELFIFNFNSGGR